ncbi:MAG TPA: helix-turn-helix transcriptional regulator [Streptomyces sp.]|nr:helix-turn-helix transcriptional regulator [Streptomyces sp.]
MDGLYAALGQRLLAARRRRGVTQQELADAVGLTRASVANIEAGNQRIQVHTLIAAAQALGLDPAVLLSEALESGRP